MHAVGRALWRWLKKLIARLIRVLGITTTTHSESKSPSENTRISIEIGDMSFDCVESRLLALPAELRNNIWELIFTPDTCRFSSCEHGDVNLLDAKGPSSHPLLICYQIYCEARGFYASALSRYWRDTRFFVHGGAFAKDQTSKPLMNRLSTVDERAISKIQHLTICGPSDECSVPTMQLQGGIWRLSFRRSSNPRTEGSQYLTLVSRKFWNIAFDYNLLLLRNEANYEAVRGKTLLCHLWSTPSSDPEQDHAEAFHLIKADVSDHNLLFIRVIKDEMGQKGLTKEDIRGAVRSHIQMAQQ
jgi:hypothetical protein